MMSPHQNQNQRRNAKIESSSLSLWSSGRKREKPSLFWQRKFLLCVFVFALTYVPFQLWLISKSTNSSLNENVVRCSWQDWWWHTTTSQSHSLEEEDAKWTTSQRYTEVQTQLKVERIVTHQMTKRARERGMQREYHQSTAKELKEHQNAYFRLVQQTLQQQLSPKFLPNVTWAYNSFADISILGFPKAGTSHLYRLLVTHPDTAPLFKRKEFCIDHGHFLDYTGTLKTKKRRQQQQQHQAQEDEEVTNSTLSRLQKKLWTYHKHVYKKRQNITEEQRYNKNKEDDNNTKKTTLLINACLQPEELEYHAAYSPLPTTAKFIFLFRDPADWLWATWNFWFDRTLDFHRPRTHDWASPGIHYRSPELFHELILSDETIKPAATRFVSMRQETIHTPRRIQTMVGKENVLCLKNEDMRPNRISLEANNHHRHHNVGGHGMPFLDRLAHFTGLDKSKFDSTVVFSGSNCNSEKGYGKVCNISKTGAGNSDGAGESSDRSESYSQAYEITHHRPMLQATRHLIYLQFHEECKVWAEEFGVFYDDCLAVLPS